MRRTRGWEEGAVISPTQREATHKAFPGTVEVLGWGCPVEAVIQRPDFMGEFDALKQLNGIRTATG